MSGRTEKRGFEWLVPFLAVLGCCLVAAPAMAIFPLEEGELVASCFADPSGFVPGRYVVGIVDARNPGCAPGVQKGENWAAAMYHNEMPNPTGDPADEWTFENLGQVFGIALDDAQPPNIYVTSSSAYGREAAEMATGRVFRLDGTDGAISVLANLPNQIFDGEFRPGLGNLAYHAEHAQLFVTNMEDGKIYRVAKDGGVIDAYDPFRPDDGQPGFAPLGERLWGIGVHGCRVYFSVWQEDCGRQQESERNSIWSVGLDPDDGSFLDDLTHEIDMPEIVSHTGVLYSNPVADIEFSAGGRMLIGERTMSVDIRTNAHQSRVLEFAGGHSNWVLSATEFVIGVDDIGFSCGVGSGTNASGGVDYECAMATACDNSGKIWATGDALHFGPDGSVYGLQGMPSTGGGPSDSYLVDLDGNLTQDAKTLLGDVDVYRTCRSSDGCSAIDDGELQCANCATCNAPGLCEASIECSPSVATCVTGSGFEQAGCTPVGPYPVGRTAVDVQCGDDRSQCEVEVRDCEPPRCQAPPTLEIECAGSCGTQADDPRILEWLDRAVGEDNCAVSRMEANPPEIFLSGCQRGAGTSVSFEVSDAEGNKGTCEGSIVVRDTTPPLLSVPEPVSVECAGRGGVSADHATIRRWLSEAAADDLCGDALLWNDAPEFFPSGCGAGTPTRVEFLTEDDCLNLERDSSIVTVRDTTPPTVAAPRPMTLECSGPGGISWQDLTVQAWLAQAEAQDACGTPELEHDAPRLFPSGCGAGRSTAVRFTATDACNLTTIASSSLTVTDRVAPRLEVPPPLVLDCDGQAAVSRDDPRIQHWLQSVFADDSCGSVEVIDDAPAEFPASCAPGATTAVEFTATDACGNEVSASSSVTVVDRSGPRLHVPAPLTIECDGLGGVAREDARIQNWLRSAFADDLCGEVTLSNDAPSNFPAACQPGVSTIVTFVATDSCRNQASGRSTVTVVDTLPPSIEACGLAELCLWPPNHGYVCFENATELFAVSDACGEARIQEILCHSNQCDDAPCAEYPGQNGDGATVDDCRYEQEEDRLCIRSERAASEPEGRIYEIGVVAEDDCGLIAAGTVLTVTVPHDQDPHESCLSPAPAGTKR